MNPPGDPLKRRLLGLYAALYGHFGPQRWWPGRSRFEIVAGAVLTQHTAWSGVERALANLRAARRLEPRRLAGLGPGRLGRLIRPAGTYRIKARRLLALSRFLLRRCGGRLERLRRDPLEALRAGLLAVPGVGPETADSILLYGAGRPVFVVDAYARRVLTRHRIMLPGIGYEELRARLESHLPRDPRLFNEYHALLVAVGKRHCRALPRCAGCPLRADLARFRIRPPRR
jgi:endonuclease III related protein